MSHSVSSREVFTPGNVVKLNHPYRLEPLVVQQLLKAFGGFQATVWQGFTHGIIATRIAPNACGTERVSLYLYDPTLPLLYLNPHTGCPRQVDFAVDQLAVVHVARFPRNKQPASDGEAHFSN